VVSTEDLVLGFASRLSRVTELFNGVFFQSPEAVAGDAADSRQYFQFFNEWVLDPNTGIIAGFLNARDDLATASTLPAELGTLLNPPDLFAA
jgi:hypothetical protein